MSNIASIEVIRPVAVTYQIATGPTLAAHAALAARVTVVEESGGGGGGANLTTSRTSTTVTVASDSGTDATLAAADGSNAGVMTAAQATALAAAATAASVTAEEAARIAGDARIFHLRDYGAVGDGVTDDGPAIRDALTAAAAFGFGYCVGEPGKNYLVIPLSVTGALWTAWRAIAMPANVTLDLSNSTLTAQHQSGSQDGCIIGPAGTESVASDYGAASGWTLRNATLATSSGSSVTTGNVVSIHRCQNVTIENVRTGSAAAYHFLEIQRVKNVKIRNFTILHESGAGAAHPEIQLDGNGNPASPTSSFAHTTVMEDVLFENVQMRTLGADATKVRRIEIGHSAGTYRRVTFRGCYLAGLTNSGIGDYAILDCNAIAGVVVEDMLIEGCTFQHDAMSSGGGTSCIKFPDTANVTLRGLVVRNNRFIGSYRGGVQVGSMSVTSVTSGNYALKRGIHIHDNYFAPSQDATVAGQTGTTRVICAQGCEDVVIENNFELSPATESNVTSNAYNSISSLNNKRAHIRGNTIVRQQAAIGDMASGDNNGIYLRVDNVLALSGTQEVVLDVVGNSITGVHRIGLYESADPAGTWAAGAYTRVRGTRRGNVFHTAGTVANQYALPTGEWAARAGSMVAGTADVAADGIYLCDGRAVSGMSGLSKHVATALFGANLPTLANTCVVLAPRYVESTAPASTTSPAAGYFSAVNVAGTVTATLFSGSGASLTTLNASNLASGTVNHARLGTGGGGSTKFLREDGTWQTLGGGGDAVTSGSLDQFADVTQTAGQTLAISSSTTLAGGTHSGTNTGDQTITLTGDVTGSGTGSFAATLANTAVTPGSYTLASITVDAKGRITAASNGSAGSGDVTAASAFATDNVLVRSDGTGKGVQATAWSVADTGAMSITLSFASTGILTVTNSGNGIAVQGNSSGGGIGVSGNDTGGGIGVLGENSTVAGHGVWGRSDVSGGVGVRASAGHASAVPLEILNVGNFVASFTFAGTTDRAFVIPDAAGTLALTSQITGTNSGTNTGDQTITLTGDVTGSGTGSFAATIASGAVSLAKMANMATASVIYRKTAGTGAPEVQTLATLKTDLGLTGTNSGDQTLSGLGGLPLAGGQMTGNITFAEGADPATCGIHLDAAMSADERYNGITIPGTAGATLAFGDLCYLDVTAAEWLLADADAISTSGDVVLGICVDASTDGAATSMLLMGTVRSAAFPASIALGAPVYVSTTAGDITATQPSGTDDVIRVVGWAVTVEPNTIYFNPSSHYHTHT